MELVLFFLQLFLAKNVGTIVTINNAEPRVDVNGIIMDAHDGSIRKFSPEGPYYYHAMQYGLCQEPTRYGCDQTSDSCGFQQDHNISIWSSPNLSGGSWTYVANAINVTDRPAGIVYRPHAIYNPNTKKYVLWFNVVNSKYTYVAATSDTVEGPYTVQNPEVNVTLGGGGDFDLFLDNDGSCYLIYSQNYLVSIELLTPDCLHSSGKNLYVFPEYFVEAPTVFVRNSIYYALFGWCCCYCYQGSGVLVHTAPSITGPWLAQTEDLACVPSNQSSLIGAEPTPDQGCQYHDPSTTSITRAQQNFIIQADSPTGDKTFVYTGDRWEQAPDGLKGHDPQYWIPMSFNADGSIDPLKWVDSFSIDVV